MSAAAEHFTATVPADLGMLRDFRHRLTLWLEAAGVREERDAILLAAHEAAANGIQNGAGPVTVVGRVEPDVILIEVTTQDGGERSDKNTLTNEVEVFHS